MCLAVVGKIVELHGTDAVADIEGNRVPIITAMAPGVKCNDYVLVHAGFAISQIGKQEYEEQRRIFREIESIAQRTLNPK